MRFWLSSLDFVFPIFIVALWLLFCVCCNWFLFIWWFSVCYDQFLFVWWFLILVLDHKSSCYLYIFSVIHSICCTCNKRFSLFYLEINYIVEVVVPFISRLQKTKEIAFIFILSIRIIQLKNFNSLVNSCFLVLH